MKLVTTLLVVATLFVSQVITSQEKITIKAEVVNVTSNEGKVGFALYNKTTFMKEPIQALNAKIENNKSVVVFKDITPGEYAIICYHDKNNNDSMDFSPNGMPLEDYGASNNKLNPYGPPTFDSAKFTVSDKNVSLEIRF